jgi:hypothetical protein
MSKRELMWLSPLTAVLAGAAFAHPPALSAPEVPAPIMTPAGESVVLLAHAVGAQIYQCAASAGGKPQWTLKSPDAELHDSRGAVIGHHSAGPSWKLNDGSGVTGKVEARIDAPAPDSVPWLLLEVVTHEGKGSLEQVTHVQRINTRGGQPPQDAPCEMANLNSERRVPYSADYYFYAPATAK